jgi:hypothetical protein
MNCSLADQDGLEWGEVEYNICVVEEQYLFRRGNYVRFEVFTVVTRKNGVFWVVTSCGSCKNRCFRGT